MYRGRLANNSTEWITSQQDNKNLSIKQFTQAEKHEEMKSEASSTQLIACSVMGRKQRQWNKKHLPFFSFDTLLISNVGF